MNTKQKLDAVKAAIDAVEKDLLDPTSGEFKHQPDFADDIQLAADIEAVYVANGGVLSPDVAKALSGAAAVVKILGV
jgi:hypothetical protein